jgi:hypothetical protein
LQLEICRLGGFEQRNGNINAGAPPCKNVVV